MFLRLVFAASAMVACANALAETIPANDFAKRGQFSNPRMSPDGAHIAVTVREKNGEHDVWRLAIYRLKDMQVATLLKMRRGELPADYLWASDTRLVVAKAWALGSLEKPALTGEIVATDVDGKNQQLLFGEGFFGSLKDDGLNSSIGYLAGAPESHNGHFYLSVPPLGEGGRSVLFDMDAQTNKLHRVADIKVSGMTFVVQHDGDVRFAVGGDDTNEFAAYRKEADGTWKKLTAGIERFIPVAISADDKDVFAYFSADGSPLALVRQPVEGGERVLLADDRMSNVSVLRNPGTPRLPFAVTIGPGIPHVRYLDAQRPEAMLHKALAAKFPGSYVSLISGSKDQSKFLFGVASDRDPGGFYLFDAQAKRVAKLFAEKPWIDPAKMGERRPFCFKASDGVELCGFLTLPANHEPKKLPLVLLPHGGPFGVTDSWAFDDDAQFLASRGYAVLQVNYRGSGGRGQSFMRSGFRQWGTRIQDDLLDGVQWAIKEGIADSDRICAFGTSFGGYAAMMSAIRAPSVIKCAIGYAGVYDLPLMREKGDVQERLGGHKYMDEVIGDDMAELKANSPVNLVDKLNSPVLIIHGREDQRSPFAHAQALRRALDKAGKPYEWFAVPKEGHGFYTEEHRRQVYEKLEAFLAKHIG